MPEAGGKSTLTVPPSGLPVALLVGLLLACVALACASAGEEPKLTPQTVGGLEPDRTPEPSPEPPPVPTPPTQEELEEKYGRKTIVIDEGAAEEAEEPSLIDAARSEQERRSGAGQPVAVITNSTLSDFAGGDLTVSNVTVEPVSTTEPASVEEDGEAEAYWRQRVRDLRQQWADAEEEARQLEANVSSLRMQFYAEDDPFYRDSQIKPVWDRTIDRLEETRELVTSTQEELELALDEARLAGALPGWLREGIELEPQPVEEVEPIHEPGEPDVIEVDGRR